MHLKIFKVFICRNGKRKKNSCKNIRRKYGNMLIKNHLSQVTKSFSSGFQEFTLLVDKEKYPDIFHDEENVQKFCLIYEHILFIASERDLHPNSIFLVDSILELLRSFKDSMQLGHDEQIAMIREFSNFDASESELTFGPFFRILNGEVVSHRFVVTLYI